LLKITDQSFEFGLLTQAFEMGIDPEEGPARETRFDAALQPRHRLVRFSQYGINAGDLIISVVRVAEGARRIESSADTLDRTVALVAPGVQHTLHADDQGSSPNCFRAVANRSSAKSKSPL